MRTYIEKLGKEYIEGRKESGKSPLRTGLYGEKSGALHVMEAHPTFLLSNARCHRRPPR